jgi:protein-tyrosine phosphatase
LNRLTLTLASPTSTPPTKSSYWVVPGLLLAGGYPGDRNSAQHRRKIQAIVDAGIRTFVNLMEEGETNHVGEPFAPYQDLARQMCSEVVCVRYPIPDLTVPMMSQTASILDAIDDALETAKPVYVHCWGGVGRTGMIIGCWLLRHGLADPSNVLDVLMRIRQQDQERRHRMSPETPEQREFIQQWQGKEVVP